MSPYKVFAIVALGAAAASGLASLTKENPSFAADPWYFPLLAALILSILQN